MNLILAFDWVVKLGILDLLSFVCGDSDIYGQHWSQGGQENQIKGRGDPLR
jgi:hypothetical protein